MRSEGEGEEGRDRRRGKGQRRTELVCEDGRPGEKGRVGG